MYTFNSFPLYVFHHSFRNCTCSVLLVNCWYLIHGHYLNTTVIWKTHASWFLWNRSKYFTFCKCLKGYLTAGLDIHSLYSSSTSKRH